MLNSFWGKFDQRCNLGTSEYFTNPKQYFKCVFDDTKVIKSIRFVYESTINVNWIYEDEFIEVIQNTNPVNAAYTTAQARLKLYSYIEILNGQMLYFDSIIYVSRPGDPEPEIGSYLGQMTKNFPPTMRDHILPNIVWEDPRITVIKFVRPTTRKSMSK